MTYQNTSSVLLPTLYEFKTKARDLRDQWRCQGRVVGHHQSLEAIAVQWGYRDWNILSAAVAANAKGQSKSHSNKRSEITHPLYDQHPHQCPVKIGQMVGGQYLGQSFIAKVLGIHAALSGRYRLSLHCETPIDVVTFESFSSFRQRLRATIDHHGVSLVKTSDGTPHLILDL